MTSWWLCIKEEKVYNEILRCGLLEYDQLVVEEHDQLLSPDCVLKHL